MTEYDGNLALQRRRSTAAPRSGRLQPVSRPTPPAFKPRRIAAAAIPTPVKVAEANARAIRRNLARQRLKMLLAAVMIVFVVTGVFSLIVYRQARILEMNYANLSLEREISKTEQRSGQISESLAQKTNLDLIRQQAIERLGMQDPAASQTVLVSMPDTDRVVFMSSDPVSDDNEAYLTSVFTALEGYFKNMSRQRQGD